MSPGRLLRHILRERYLGQSDPLPDQLKTFREAVYQFAAAGRNLNSYLAESVLPVGSRNFVTGRAELVDKDELFSAQPEIDEQLAVTAGSTFRVGSYTIGYTRDIPVFDRLETGIGFNFSTYSLPQAIKPYYGDHPVSGNIFIRFRLRSSS